MSYLGNIDGESTPSHSGSSTSSSLKLFVRRLSAGSISAGTVTHRNISDQKLSSRRVALREGQEREAKRGIIARWGNLSKDVCFWVVPPHDGKVRRFRCTLRMVAGAALCLSLAVATFLFLAGDYARTQFLRAQVYFTLKSVLRERDHLVRDNEALKSEMASLHRVQSRALQYESGLKARLEELETVLNLGEELGVLQPGTAGKGNDAASALKGASSELIKKSSKLSKSSDNLAASEADAGQPSDQPAGNGLGGAERDCDPNVDGELCSELSSESTHAPSLIESIEEDQGGRASISWKDSDYGASPVKLAPVSYVGPATGDMIYDQSLIERIDHLILLVKLLPVGMPGDGHVRSKFGPRLSPFSGKVKMHEGIDLSLPHGSSIYSTAEGVVKTVERNPTYGLMVDIAHGKGIVTRYAHLSKAFVSEGESVCKGESIGLVGSSGRSTGPHLHYEIRVNGVAKNPQKFFELGKRLARLSSSEI